MKYFIIIVLCTITTLEAAYQQVPPPPVIQYKPKYEPGRTSTEEIRKQMAEIDYKIQKLYQDKSDYQVKSESATQLANSLLDQYHDQVNQAQRYQQQSQTIDSQIATLVQKKADLSKELKR